MTLKERLLLVDNGIFKNIIDQFDWSDDSCYQCWSLNPNVTDPGKGYRCACFGTCPGETLSKDLISYLFWQIGDITQEQHMRNVRGV